MVLANPTTRRIHRTLLITFALAALIFQSARLIFPDARLETIASAAPFLPGPAIEGTVFAVTTGNRLLQFNRETPGAINRSLAITGTAPNENIVAIDFRPRTGQLIALSDASRLYTLNTQTGAAAPIGPAFTPPLSGAAFGFDFNPTVDRIRLVSNADQNLRLNPDTGAVAAVDTALGYALGDVNVGVNPNVVASAYTGSFLGSTQTTLYGIDSNLDTLVLQGSINGAPTSPNTGLLTTVGPLGVNTTDLVGFDIVGHTGEALASLTPQGAASSSLYSVNLANGSASVIGAIGGGETVRDIAAVTRVETIFAVTSGNRLLQFSSASPGVIVSSLAITGLGSGENILGIDFRPATGQLFALSSANLLYTLNTDTGAATRASGAPLAPAIAGTAFGIDFNPTVDRIRLVSNTRQNLRLNPNNGTVAASDALLAYAANDANATTPPNAVAAAYTDNTAGVTSTSLYIIDSNLDTLAIQGSPGGAPVSPNTGQLITIGSLGVNTTDLAGFDIAGDSGAAFASLTLQGAASSSLYTINLASGAATVVGAIGGGETVRDIAVAPRVETVFAVNSSGQLISFNALTPGVVQRRVTLSGPVAGQSIVGLDFRPATGQLYAMTAASRLYLIDPATGGSLLLGNAAFNPPLSGAAFGFDFNPTVDRIRVVSDSTQNLRLHPETAVVAGTDTPLAYAVGDVNFGKTPSVAAAAYNNNFAGATSTTLYVIDAAQNALALQGSVGGGPVSPNTGQLTTVGPLDLDVNETMGFDISDCTGLAYATLTTTQGTRFYRINLRTGLAVPVGQIGAGEAVGAIAIVNTPPASAQESAIAIVNAASFAGGPLASDSIASAFGAFQTINGQLYTATSEPLPTVLGGLRVTVNGVDAQLFAASNSQINFLIPAVDATQAVVVVTNSDGTTRVGMLSYTPASPGIFSVRGTGQGTAAALTTTDGVTLTPVFNPDASAREIDPGTAQRPTFLVLFTTGLRNAPVHNQNDANGVAEAVRATIQGVPAQVVFAGPAPNLTGVDQVNLIIPPELAGVGTARVRLEVDDRPSNIVTIWIGGAPPRIRSTPILPGPVVSGLLTPDDQVQDAGDGSGRSYFFDAYSFTTTAANTTVGIDMRSTQFDTAVLLYRVGELGRLTLVAADDQTGGLGNNAQENDNALLLTVLADPGDYVIFATSSDIAPSAVGSYTLRLATGIVQPIVYGANLNASIFTNDIRTSAGVYLDAYWFSGQAGDRVAATMASGAFNSFLLLNQANGELLAFDDDSGSAVTGDALLRATLPQTGNYVLIATPFEVNRIGLYTLTLNREDSAVAGEALASGANERERTTRVRYLEAEREERNASFDGYAARRIVVR